MKKKGRKKKEGSKISAECCYYFNRAREILMYVYIELGTVCPREVRVNVYAVSLCCTAA
jgi:hypothetical protein